MSHIQYFLILLSEYTLYSTIWYSFTFVICVREIAQIMRAHLCRVKMGGHNRSTTIQNSVWLRRMDSKGPFNVRKIF